MEEGKKKDGTADYPAQYETFHFLRFDEHKKDRFWSSMKISENFEKAEKRIEKITDRWYYSKYEETAEMNLWNLHNQCEPTVNARYVFRLPWELE